MKQTLNSFQFCETKIGSSNNSARSCFTIEPLSIMSGSSSFHWKLIEEIFNLFAFEIIADYGVYLFQASEITVTMMNNSSEPTVFDEEDFEMTDIDDVTKIVTTSAYAIIFLFSFLGNSLVIHIVRTRVSIRRNPFNWLLVNTAVADLLNVTTASALTVPVILCENRWISGVIGTILCKLTVYMLPVSICVSIWSLAIIAIDRYLAIVCAIWKRKRAPLSHRSVKKSIVAVWIFAGLIFSEELYKYTVYEVEGEAAECHGQWHNMEPELSDTLYRAEIIVRVVITYAVPLLVISVLYSLIAKFLWTHKPPGNATLQVHIKRTRRHRAVIKMLVTAVVVFAICWLPVHIAHIMEYFYTDIYDMIPFGTLVMMYWLAHANAAIHPWLFIYFGENLRMETKGIFQHLSSRKTNVLEQFRQQTFSLPTLYTDPDTVRRANRTKRDSFIAINAVWLWFGS